MISQNVSRMMVMYGGMVVESGSTRDVFIGRAHPYTQGLFASRPSLASASTGKHTAARQRLPAIPGTVPELHLLPKGCPFAGRCTVALPDCADTMPNAIELSPGHSASCVLATAP
jgi:peptide/nickel transport system ATP-binding protein